jgi:hypothetical protein
VSVEHEINVLMASFEEPFADKYFFLQKHFGKQGRVMP